MALQFVPDHSSQPGPCAGHKQPMFKGDGQRFCIWRAGHAGLHESADGVTWGGGRIGAGVSIKTDEAEVIAGALMRFHNSAGEWPDVSREELTTIERVIAKLRQATK